MSTVSTKINVNGVQGREYVRAGSATEVITPGQLVMEVTPVSGDTISKRTLPTTLHTPLIALDKPFQEFGESDDYQVGEKVAVHVMETGRTYNMQVSNTTGGAINIALEDYLSSSTTLAGNLEPTTGTEAKGACAFVAIPSSTVTIGAGLTTNINCRFLGNL